jgi:hypothetical protein
LLLASVLLVVLAFALALVVA